jgi:hypothetical protein
MTLMKTLREMEISDELNTQIIHAMALSKVSKTEVVRQALKIGLPQFAAEFQPPSLWLQDRLREALAEFAEPVSAPIFVKKMKAIAYGR